MDGKNELILKRVFNAPRKIVFDAWMKQKHIEQWWGPTTFTNSRCEWNAVAGGKIRIDMLAPDATLFPLEGEFREILAPEKIIFTTSTLDQNFNPLFTVNYTAIFSEENDGKSKLVLSGEIPEATPSTKSFLDEIEENWNGSIDKLEVLLTLYTFHKNQPTQISQQ